MGVIAGFVLTPILAWLAGIPLFWIWIAAVSVFLATLLVVSVFVDRLPRWGDAVHIKCYPQRASAEWYRREVEKAGHVSVLWNTGKILKDEGVLDAILKHTDRLLLPHPFENPTLNVLAEVADKGGTVEKLAEKILEVTRFAREEGARVRWWPGLTGNVMTIAPEWILVEQFMPYLWANDRPRYRIEKHTLPKLYENLSKAYNQIWDDSVRLNDAAFRQSTPDTEGSQPQ